MNQRWPLLHRRASVLESMTALSRHTGLRFGAGKRLGKVERSSIGGRKLTTLSTMPGLLERLGPIPCVGTGRRLGFCGISPASCDWPSLGLYSLPRHRPRCYRVGGRSSRVNFDTVTSKVERASKSNLGSRYIIDTRHVHLKQLRPFYFHGWPTLPGCNSLVREINSRSIVEIQNSRSLAECMAPSRDEASVDEDGSSKVMFTSNFKEEIVWEETITSTRSSSDEAERTRERASVSESSCEEFKEGSFTEGEQKVPVQSQVDPTIIVFDIETTGFLKSGNKIVELACRDLAGGDRSTLETLVNPHQPVPLASTAVHKITSEMVNQDDIPSWAEVMTAFVDFVENRQKGDEKVILVAHNGRRFDVPFIMKECYECSMEIPSHWYFLDTIDLAKTMLKKRFGKTKLYNLQYLYYDCYNLPRLKDAHRAGVDVDMLASVFGKLLMDLEMPVSELLDQTFTTSDIELKPGLLLRENSDRYTSLSKEMEETLLDQSMSELIVHERNVDIQSENNLDTLLEQPGQGQDIEPEGARLSYVETEKHWKTSTSSSSLSRSLIGKDSSACTEETHQTDLKDDESLITSLLGAAAQSPGDGNLKHSEELSIEIVNTTIDDVALGVIRSDVRSGNAIEALSPGTTDEELLRLSRDTSAPEAGTMCWEDKFVLHNAQDNKNFEFEDALGLVRGNEEGLATNTFVPSIVNQVKKDSCATSPCVPGDIVSLNDLQESRREESSISILLPSSSNDHSSSNGLLPSKVSRMEDLMINEELQGSGSARQSRTLTPAVGDGILQPLNIGCTLLSKKRGKRRGTGDVQTTATRNIAHTVADCEEQIFVANEVADAAVLDMPNIKPIQQALDQKLNGSSHSVEDEKQRGTQEQLCTSSVNLSLLSPMMKQYVETKRQRPKFLLLSRVGDFYEAFFEDAEILAHACNIRLSGVDGGKMLERKVPMAGVPHHKIDVYLRTLLKKGIAVVQQDQVTATDSKGGTIIDRQVTAVLTPGTLLDEGMLEESCNNFLVAIFPHADENGTWGLAFSDISTGEFQATQGQGRSSLLQELQRLQPSEVIFPANVVCSVDQKTEVLRPIGMPIELCYSSRPTSEFFPAAAEKRLHASFGEESLEAFGLLRSPHAIRAAGGLLGYVQETQKLSNEEIPLQKPSYYSTLDTMHMDDTVRNHLELLKTSRWGKPEGSLVWALDHTQTAMGGRLLRRWLLWPLTNHELICTRHDAVEVFVKNHELRSQFRRKLANISDIERLASRIAWKRADSRDLMTLAQSIKCLPSLAELVEGASSNMYFVAASHTPTSAVQWAKKVENMLAEELGNGIQAGKVVKAGADPALDVLRQRVQETINWLEEYEKQERLRLGIPSLEVGSTKNSGHYISIRKNKLKEGSIPDDYQRLQSLKAEERFVTPLLLNCESSRLAAEAMVYEREEELLRALKEEIVSLLEPFREYSQAVATLDVLCTFADLAVTRGYCRPHVLETGREITIIGGRHPVVELSLSEDLCFVANSAYLGFDSASEVLDVTRRSGDTGYYKELSVAETMEELTDESEKWWPRADLVLLTGPNTSGKSCYLRQIGLIQLIAQAGSFVPAKFAQLSLADGLYTRVGAVDDLAAGQSTFRVEMLESANILNRATAHSLVLLDEVGRGTSSQEGAVIARAIIEYLSQIVRARTVFSTHYHDLHVLDQDYPNIANYHFQATELENGEVMFDHAVMPGNAVRSYAIAIGRGAGLPDWVCNRASELLALEEGSSENPNDSRDQFGTVALQDTLGNKLDGDCGYSEVRDKKLGIVLNEVFEDASCSEMNLAPNNGLELDLLKGSPDFNTEEGKVDGDVLVPLTSEKPVESVLLENRQESTSLDEVNSILSLTASKNFGDIEIGTSKVDEEGFPEQVEPSEQSGVHAISEERCYSREQLVEVWERVYIALQNQPATQALLKQKGSLVSISPRLYELEVCVCSSSLFVRKFQQPEHFVTLESVFASVLHQPVRLLISVLNSADRSPI